jgi:ATP-dependent Lon protease
MFITTANNAARASRCRCRTAWRSSSCSGYTEFEKLAIARQYLLTGKLGDVMQESRRRRR